MRKVMHVVGARPNFMKTAPIHRALCAHRGISQVLVHTGQHYDPRMSEVFFADLGLPAPRIHLGVGSGRQSEQTARVMIALEEAVVRERPELISVVGDVNSTLAAALVAAKAGIPLSHVEAGLRSYDRSMPEEINRLVTDRLADLLLTPSPDANENLRREGCDPERIFFVGNVMIDTLLASRETALRLPVLQKLGLEPRGYAVCTLHRPANVDNPVVLRRLLAAMARISRSIPVIFPVHPRTRKTMAAAGLEQTLTESAGLRPLEPLGYVEFLALTSQARLILTDSGGLQEESTALGVPCLTLRESTERPVTVTVGTNLLVGTEPATIEKEVDRILAGGGKQGRVPDLWDGRTGHRIGELYAKVLEHGLPDRGSA